MSFGTTVFSINGRARVKTFGNRVLAKAYQSNSEKVRGKRENCIINNFFSNQGERDECSMWRIWGKGEIQTRFWWGNLREELDLVTRMERRGMDSSSSGQGEVTVTNLLVP